MIRRTNTHKRIQISQKKKKKTFKRISQANKKMKQKILIRVTMTDDKTRAKAMKKAVQFKGVSAVEIKGDHRNQIEVTGVEIDMIPLVKKIRKEVAFAELVSVTKVEPPKKEEEKKGPGVDKKDGGGKEGDKKEADKKGPDDNKKVPDDKKVCEDKKKPVQTHVTCHPSHGPIDCSNPVQTHVPCHPSHGPIDSSNPWSQGYGVPSCFPYPCNPYDYLGEPVYNPEPKCTIM